MIKSVPNFFISSSLSFVCDINIIPQTRRNVKPIPNRKIRKNSLTFADNAAIIPYMFTYPPTNPFVYIEPTVISYAVADPSTNAKLALWQAESRRFLNAYQHQLAFVVSDAVLNEIRKGDPSQAQKRLTAIAHFANCL